MKLAPPQVKYYLADLKRSGITNSRHEVRARIALAEELDPEAIAQVLAALEPPPAAPAPPQPEPAEAETPRSKEAIAAIFRKAKGEDKPKKPSGPKGEPAKRIELKPENQFRIYQPAPVVAINRYGTVRWVADGRQHKAGELIEPRIFQGKLTVRFRYDGEQVERLIGFMLETVGWVKRRAKKAPSE